MEVEWDTATPDDTVAALVERFGSRNRIAVAVDASALYLKRIPLPGLSAVERCRIVALDPERFFPVRDEPLVVGVGEDDLVVAVRAAVFDRMTEALRALGTVERVEPTPFAVARHLQSDGVTQGWIILANPQEEDCAVVRVENGRPAIIRKLPLVPEDVVVAVSAASGEPVLLHPWQPELAERLAALGLQPSAIAPPRGSTEAFVGSHGAGLGVDSSEEPTLVSQVLERRRAARALRRGALAVASIVVALAAVILSADVRRERALRTIEGRAEQLQSQALTVETLLADIDALQDEVTTMSEVARVRPDPLEVLLLLTRLLPEDAFLSSIHVAGTSWEVDGYARDAATLVPTLEASPLLADVRFRNATTRVQLANGTYESYALAFRYAQSAQ
jgi:Tfp pilus assembly protein PilN